MRHFGLCVIGLLLAAWTASVSGEDKKTASPEEASRPVGALGRPECLTFEGKTVFSQQQLRDALFGDFDVFLASRSPKPLNEYLALLSAKLEKGYRNVGFPTARVRASVSTDGGKVVLKIDEGPRYRDGGIRVAGAKTVPVSKLIERLVNKHPPKDATTKTFVERNGKMEPVWIDKDGKEQKLSDAVWERRKPASFLAEDEPESKLHEDISDALADFGYFFAKFTAAILPDTETKKAVLIVNISDEGPRCMLDDIEISGNKRNSREEILKYLAIKSGQALTNEELTRIRTLLWRSGRFITFDVSPVQPANPGEKSRLEINLVELKDAPLLAKPFSREEEILQKFRDWISRPDHWDGDLCMHLNNETVEKTVVISPKHGTLMEVNYRKTPTAKPVTYSVIVSPDEVGIYTIGDGRRLTFPSPKTQIYASFTLRLDEKANELKMLRHSFVFGAGFNSEESDSRSPIRLDVDVSPVLAVDMVHGDDAKCSIHDGILTVTSSNDCGLRVDATTGRLVELAFMDDEEDSQKDSKPDKKAGKKADVPRKKADSITFRRGEFQRRVESLRATMAKQPNFYQAGRPVSSLLAFTFEEDFFWKYWELNKSKIGQKSTRQVLRRLLDEKVCEPLDEMVCKLFADSDENDFTIPQRSGNGNPTFKAFAVWAWQLSRRCFPPDSWPDIICRALILDIIGQENAAEEDWQQLLRPGELGPLGSLVVPLLAEKQNPQLADLVRKRSEQHLSVEDVRKEYPTFLDQKYPVGRCFRRLILSLRKLDDADIQTLSELLPDKSAAAFRHWADHWRKDQKQSADQTMRELLDSLWQFGMHDRGSKNTEEK
jgi:hypothetical protein